MGADNLKDFDAERRQSKHFHKETKEGVIDVPSVQRERGVEDSKRETQDGELGKDSSD